MAKSEETAFLRGEIGVDGQAIEEEVDEAEAERAKAREALARGSAYLGREFLTWLLWRTNSGDALAEVDGEPITALLVDRITLKGIAGEATEISARGVMAPYAEVVRFAIDKGLAVHSARLRLTHGERVYQVSLDAERFDLRSGKLPDLLTEEEDDRISERLFLVEKLSEIVEALLAAFLEVRTRKEWRAKTVPAIKRWLKEG